MEGLFITIISVLGIITVVATGGFAIIAMLAPDLIEPGRPSAK